MTIDAKFLSELQEYVAIPSVSAQPEHAANCRRAAQWMSDKLKSLGFTSQLVETGGHPLVFSKFKSSAEASHIVIYGHTDVQPADITKEDWEGRAPFHVTIKDDYAWGRGVADNKGPTLALIYGLAAALKNHPKLKLNITCLIEAEEEIGSKNLTKTLEQLKPSLGPVDAVILSDTSSPSAQQLAIVTGTRGIMGFDVHVMGLARDLHSGNGGPVPNAASELARVVATLFDEQGKVTIPGFYDGCVTPTAEQIKGVAATNSAGEFMHAHGNKGFYPLCGQDAFVAQRYWPSLELNGMYSGYQGQGSKTIIPATATAKFTCRIAPGQDPEKFSQVVIAGVKARLDNKLFDCEVDFYKKPMSAYSAPVPHLGGAVEPGVSPRFKDIFQAVHDAAKNTTGNAPLYVAEGASIPVLPDIRRVLGAHAIMLGLAGEDAGMHSPQEKANLPLLKTGIKTWQNFFETLGS